eukprot:6189128-Pleurochrysis_carterae.AAC.3
MIGNRRRTLTNSTMKLIFPDTKAVIGIAHLEPHVRSPRSVVGLPLSPPIKERARACGFGRKETCGGRAVRERARVDASARACVYASVRASERASERACVRACVYASMLVGVRACVRACVHACGVRLACIRKASIGGCERASRGLMIRTCEQRRETGMVGLRAGCWAGDCMLVSEAGCMRACARAHLCVRVWVRTLSVHMHAFACLWSNTHSCASMCLRVYACTRENWWSCVAAHSGRTTHTHTCVRVRAFACASLHVRACARMCV